MTQTLRDMTYPYSQDLANKRIVTLDIETFYGTGYSLRTYDYMDYVTSPKFKFINAAVQVDNGETIEFRDEASLAAHLLAVGVTSPNVVTVAHNMRFEATFLSMRLGIEPAELMCTMCMARASGMSRVFGQSLEDLSRALLDGEKNIAPMLEALPMLTADKESEDSDVTKGIYEAIAIHVAKLIVDGVKEIDPQALHVFQAVANREYETPMSNGKRPTRWQVANRLTKRKSISVVDLAKDKDWDSMGADLQILYSIYVKHDVRATKEIFDVLAPLVSHREARMIHLTMDAYAYPRMAISAPLAENALEEEETRVAAIIRTAVDNGFSNLTDEAFRKFARTRIESVYAVAVLLGLAMPELTKENRKDLPAIIRTAIEQHNMNLPQGKPPVPEFVTIKKGKYSMSLSKDSVVNDYVLAHYPKGTVLRDLWEAKLALSSTQETSRLKTFIRKGEAYDKHPAPLEYGSAHTLRYGGCDGMNVQNLGQGSPLRAAIQALPGRALVSVDSAQIEPRWQAVICNDHELLRVFRTGQDVYMHTAASIFGQSYESLVALKDSNPEEYKRIRDIGKVARLSLGYAMGGKTFGRRGELWNIMFAEDVATHYEEAKIITRAFRKGNPAITRMWKQLENGFSHAIDGIDTRMGGEDGRLIHIYPMQYRGARIVVMEIPGVRMMYTNLRWQYDEEREMTQMVYDRYQKGRMTTESIYGGKALENVTQALASCVIKEQGIVAEEMYGYPFLFNVHDENISECERSMAAQVAHNTIEIMRTPPCWAPNLPLGAEGLIGKSFMGAYEYTIDGGVSPTKNSETAYGVDLWQ